MAKREIKLWLKKNLGLMCLAVGWVFAFAPICQKAVDPVTPAAIWSFLVACFAFGFGIGWIFRDEGGSDD